MRIVVALSFAAFGLALSGCASAPFGYAEDRCVGAYNRCTTSCTEMERVSDGPASASCYERCRETEARCYGSGDDTPNSLAADSAVSEALSREQKERGYSEWKRDKERDEGDGGL